MIKNYKAQMGHFSVKCTFLLKLFSVVPLKKYQDLGRPRYVIGKQFKENFKLYFLASMVRNTRFEKVQSKSQVSHHAFRA